MYRVVDLKVTLKTAALLAFFTAFLSAHIDTAAASISTKSVSGRLIVGFKPGSDWPKRERAVTKAGGVLKQRLANATAAEVVVQKGGVIGKLERRLNSSAAVSYVEPDYIVEATKLPNDVFFDRLYAHSQASGIDIDTPKAWDQRTNCSKIAVLDTGVQVDHPDLKNNIWVNKREVPDNGRDDDDNGYIDDYYGVNIRAGKGSAVDDNGHGTHVAGIAAAVGNNTEGVTGVCWSAKIMPVKFLGETGEGSVSAGIDAINYAIDHGAKVINCSFGTDQPSQALREVIKYAKKRKVLVVIAAGNEAVNNDRIPSYPANFSDSNIISVGASNANDELADFSNFGAKSVDLLAPGESIGSTFINSEYVLQDGTSMATPFVAATAAMLKAQKPKATPQQIRSAILGSVDKVPALKGKVVSSGRLNVNSALKKIKRLKKAR